MNIRNAKEDLISQIVERTDAKTETKKAELAKLLALAANTLGWSQTDLHALLKKADDPTIRNYSALVRWSCKVKDHAASEEAHGRPRVFPSTHQPHTLTPT
jgi:hypothetical protein